MGKAFVRYFEALIINAWSAVQGTSKRASLLVFGVGAGGSFYRNEIYVVESNPWLLLLWDMIQKYYIERETNSAIS